MTAKQKREAIKTALPASISILGKTFKVTVTSLRGLHGDCDIDKKIIRVNQNSSIEDARETLFHESLHAAFAVSGLKEIITDEQEEAIVRMIEHSIYHIVDVDKLATLDK